MERRTFIIAELVRGAVAQETYELITFAQVLLGENKPDIILLGNDIKHQAAELSKKSGCHVSAITGAHLEYFNAQAFCKAIQETIPDHVPVCACLAHTSSGYDLAPLLAVRMGAACITSVENFRQGIFCRSVGSGRFVADIIPQTPSVVVTVLPGIYPPHVSEKHSSVSVSIIESAAQENASRTLGMKDPLHRDSSLKDAEVIVSAGRGVGKKDNLSLIRDLADIFPRSAVGGSRSVCDMGWLEYARQIGTTGRTVSPKLYIACGISGAVQHVAGMKGSQNIVAINTDPQAAIFHVAHFCIVEDLVSFIPLMISEYETGSGTEPCSDASREDCSPEDT